MVLDLELDNSQDFAGHTVPLSGSFSSDLSSEFWHSGMPFKTGGAGSGGSEAGR